MGLIKSNQLQANLAPFSMRDIETQAKAILLRAQQRADQLLAAAQTEGAKIRQNSYDAGFVAGKQDGTRKGTEEGRAAGMQAALNEQRVKLEQLVKALSATVTEIETSRAALESSALSQVVNLAVSIARRVTKLQGSLDPNVLTENINAAMKMVVHAADVRIALHPNQKQVLTEALPRLRMQWPKVQHVELVDDASLTPGGCKIYTAQGLINADLDKQIDRVAADLLPQRQGESDVSLLDAQLDAVDSAMPFGIGGTVQAVAGLTVEASDLPLPVGSLCKIESFGNKTTMAEVIGFEQDRTILMPLSSTGGVARGDRIENVTSAPRIWCSTQLLGRVLNGMGEPYDQKGALLLSESRRIDGRGARPMDRENIRQPISTSIRAIDGLHTCGLGQRMGIFSGPGVGKSTLISSIAKHTSADVSVVALIGERGREVLEFIENAIGPEGLKRCVIIVSTGDDTPLLKVRAAKVACTVSEYFRDQGMNVLLLMDSITRLAHAQRQIGLAAREPPATKGYPPSVFSLLPEILERAGKTAVGSITGFYTVLVEGDDFNEPIPDAIKGISDGHLWLNRALANRGHYPAIDVIQSISRVRGDVAQKEHVTAARKVISLLAIYQDIEDLVNIGAYVPGVNIDFDLAVQSRPRIIQYLQQDSRAASDVEQARKQLFELVAFIDQTEKVIRAQSAKTAPKPATAAR